jgi:hypothetical protein
VGKLLWAGALSRESSGSWVSNFPATFPAAKCDNFSQFQPISANFSQFFKFKNDFPSGAPWDGSNFWAVCPFRLYKTE